MPTFVRFLRLAAGSVSPDVRRLRRVTSSAATPRLPGRSGGFRQVAGTPAHTLSSHLSSHESLPNISNPGGARIVPHDRLAIRMNVPVEARTHSGRALMTQRTVVVLITAAVIFAAAVAGQADDALRWKNKQLQAELSRLQAQVATHAQTEADLENEAAPEGCGSADVGVGAAATEGCPDVAGAGSGAGCRFAAGPVADAAAAGPGRGGIGPVARRPASPDGAAG